MSKDRIVSAIFEKAELKTKKQAGAAYEAVIAAVQEALAEEENVNLTNFGSFSVSLRKARTGVNPKTGEQINIPETKAVKFTPGKALKNPGGAPESEKADTKKAAGAAKKTKAETKKDKPQKETVDHGGLLSVKGFFRSMEHTVKDINWPKISSEVKREIEDIEAKGKISKAVHKVSETVDEASGKLKNVGANGGDALKELGGGFERAFKEIKSSFKSALDKL